LQNPWFGSENYKQTPAMQSLVQGQGIIDIVNAYLQVALDKGLVGLALFLGVTVVAMWSAFRAIGDARRIDDELAVYCQSWLAALVGVMLVLATTTNVIAQIAEVHWLLCGICVGIGRSVAAMTASAAAAAAQAPAEIAAAPPPAETPKRPPVWAAPQRELPAHLRQYARKSENDA
jgi:O-antigen ligase